MTALDHEGVSICLLGRVFVYEDYLGNKDTMLLSLDV